MSYLKMNLKKSFLFLSGAKSYFRDVLLMHGLLMFFWNPLLASVTRFILKQGDIAYISYDNLGAIFTQHPFIFISLIGMLLLMVVSVFFEFAFLLLSIYFIKKQEPISLKQLLRGTFLQLRKIKGSTLFFFLFYFFLVLPFSGIKFNSELFSKLKIPAFILDVIFANRIIVVTGFILLYLLLIYVAIRLIFALPEMILKNKGFKEAIQLSWEETKGNFFAIFLQFFIVTATLTVLSGVSYSLIILIQYLIELWLPSYALASAITLMTLLQAVWLLNVVFSTVGIFFVTIDYMGSKDYLPDSLPWFKPGKVTQQSGLAKGLKGLATGVIGIGVLIFVGSFNAEFLNHPADVRPLTLSHRGVDNNNAVQNSIEALKLTSKSTHPDYVEMDIQETKDHEFVVFHDFNMKNLTGVSKKPNELTLDELTKIDVKENGRTEKVASFDDYIDAADALNQKLLIEIKTTKQDSPDMLDRFHEKYGERIFDKGHIIQSLTFDTVVDLKEIDDRYYVGYIMPFSVVGPPKANVDFFTLEYTTLRSGFINSANSEGKKVYAWTPNDEETMKRMMFYGIDGIITDQMELLNDTIKDDDTITYSDKLLNFVIGIG